MENVVEEPTPKYNYISAEDYLEAERNAAEKHEYYQGEVFAMSGASVKHNIIQMNVAEQLRSKLRGKNCKPFGSDLRIHIPENTLYTYPDFFIICGDLQLTDKNHPDTVTNPTVIIEILSKSTRDYDRGTKFTLYRSIETLKEYVLIDSLSVSIEVFSKNENNSWSLREYKKITETFISSALNLAIPLQVIYEEISFD
ncbi:Uma2 family endonuclease [Ferruginibacter sp.]